MILTTNDQGQHHAGISEKTSLGALETAALVLRREGMKGLVSMAGANDSVLGINS
jgi:hypothetical protein